MAVCEVCGKTFRAYRKDAATCSGRCRTALHRRHKAAEKKARSLMMTLEGGAMLQKLRVVAPAAAAAAEKLIELQGVACTEAAVKLALAAYTEGAASAAPVVKPSRRKVG